MKQISSKEIDLVMDLVKTEFTAHMNEAEHKIQQIINKKFNDIKLSVGNQENYTFSAEFLIDIDVILNKLRFWSDGTVVSCSS